MCHRYFTLKYPFEGNVLKHFCSSTEKDVNLFFFPPFWRSDLTSAVVKMRSTVIQLQLSNYNPGGTAVCSCLVNLENAHNHKEFSKEEKVDVLIIQQNTMAWKLSDSGYLSYLWAGGIVGQSHLYTPLTTTHSRVWHYLLRPAVSYEWIVFNWGNSGYICEYWALQANWMFSEKMPLKKPCELFLFCSCDCVGGLFRCKNMSGPQPLIGIKELGLPAVC